MKEFLKRIRIYFLVHFRYQFVAVGSNFYCGKNLTIRPNTVTLGDYVFIGSNAHLAVSRLVIKDFTMLAPRVGIVGGDHGYNIVGTTIRDSGRSVERSVIIEKDVWVGYNTTILHGVTIGEGSIIGANSLVTESVEPYCVVAGSPAKFIKYRFEEYNDAVRHSIKIGGDFHKGK